MNCFKFANAIFAVSAFAALSLSSAAEAGSRYGTPPPAILSADLTAPWVLQLQAPPTRGYSVLPRVYAAPTPAYRRPMAPRVQRGVNRRINRRIDRRVTYSIAQPETQAIVRAAKPGRVNLRRHASVQKVKSRRQMDPKFEPQIVSYSTAKKAGTIIIDTNEKFLYLVMGNGQARRYGVGVGKPGFEWSGTHKISRKAQWPDWRPPSEMIAREKAKGRIIPTFVEGGPQNPLGARAMYLGSSLYRIHGTNRPWTIGKAVSSGCIRMRNEDVMDLYERVHVGTRVVVS